MKRIVAFATVVCLLACPSAVAIEISYEATRKDPHGIVYAFFLDGMGEEFDSIDLSIVGDGVELVNADLAIDYFVPPGPGAPYTINNALLAAPSSTPGGRGWSLVANEASPVGIRIAGGPLGRKIDSSAPIFLANAMLPFDGRGVYSATFVNAGTTVGTATGQFPIIPEPSSELLLGLGLISLAGTRHCTQRTES